MERFKAKRPATGSDRGPIVVGSWRGVGLRTSRRFSRLEAIGVGRKTARQEGAAAPEPHTRPTSDYAAFFVGPALQEQALDPVLPASAHGPSKTPSRTAAGQCWFRGLFCSTGPPTQVGSCMRIALATAIALSAVIAQPARFQASDLVSGKRLPLDAQRGCKELSPTGRLKC